MKYYLLIFVFFIAACNQPSESPQIMPTKIDQALQEDVVALADTFKWDSETIFYNIFSPLELGYLLKVRKLPVFNEELLHDIQKAEKYHSETKIALNFGVYVADLSYLWVYDQPQEAIQYLTALEKLSRKLNIPDSFIDYTMKSMEQNVGNTDSIMAVANDAFKATDRHLKESGHDRTALLILVGAWVETLYLACEMHAQQNDVFAEKIIIQKAPLSTLLSLMQYKKDDIVVAEYIVKLVELYNAYENFEAQIQDKDLQIDSLTSSIAIKSGKLKISKEDFSEIRAIAAKIRTSILAV